MSSPAGSTGFANANEGLDRRLLMIASVVVLGAIMSILDTTVVNVAINTLARDFDTPLSTIQWIVTGYTLALATVIPLTGWAAHRFGTKRLYMLSIGLFMAGSALAGMAGAAGALIGFCVLPGLRGGMIIPARVTNLAPTAGPPAHRPRPFDPRASGGPAAHRPRHVDRRRPDAARPDPRPDPRRLARRGRLVALDLLHQPADRHRRAHARAAHPPQGPAVADRAPRRPRRAPP